MSLVRKELPLSVIEISTDNNGKSTIWLNSIDKCVLRIVGIQIQNDFDKFDQIDIDCTNGKGYVINNSIDNGKEIENFLKLLNQSIVNELDENDINYSLINDIVNLLKGGRSEREDNTR